MWPNLGDRRLARQRGPAAGTIVATHVWKRFRADRGRRLLRDELQLLSARVRGQGRGWRWALRDVDLAAEPGEAVGLIGSNGSGKSTLLKILTRVTYPHTGRVETAGRVGALIEVRAGIHGDLTGRENIKLYGTLLGLGRRQIRERFDEIVAFAELEDAIDRQVKYYSTGMQMRVGFAVAAFLEPDILLVDEVLAVGDATFQHRCLERMRTVLAQGTTLVFVSHDLAAVEATCGRGLWLRQGVVAADGPVRQVVNAYRQSMELEAESTVQVNGDLRLLKVEVAGPDGGTPRTQEPLDLRVVLDSPRPRAGRLFLGISEGVATPMFLLRRDLDLTATEVEARCRIPRLPLPRGRFFVWMGVFDPAGHDLLPWQPVARLDVAGPDPEIGPQGIVCLSAVHVEAAWEVGRR
jgi:ABC-type polysaccharide/polyol phosphate transport system ATPase subunit